LRRGCSAGSLTKSAERTCGGCGRWSGRYLTARCRCGEVGKQAPYVCAAGSFWEGARTGWGGVWAGCLVWWSGLGRGAEGNDHPQDGERPPAPSGAHVRRAPPRLVVDGALPPVPTAPPPSAALPSARVSSRATLEQCCPSPVRAPRAPRPHVAAPPFSTPPATTPRPHFAPLRAPILARRPVCW